MRTEIPVCKRCCFCLPLRYGLIVWGYVKLILACCLLLSLCLSLQHLIYMYSNTQGQGYLHEIIILTVVLSVLIVDIILHTVFVVGAHQKNEKLLKVFYFYSMAIWVLTVLLGLACAGLILEHLNFQIGYFLLIILISDMAAVFANLLAQTYILLLVRSEIVKLSMNTRCEFVNNAAEAECALRFEDPDEVREIEYEYVYEEKEEYPSTIKDVIYVCPGPLDDNVCCKDAMRNGHVTNSNKD